MFKKYLIDNEARDFINAVNLYHEIDVYHKTDAKPKTKKDIQVSSVVRLANYHGVGILKSACTIYSDLLTL